MFTFVYLTLECSEFKEARTFVVSFITAFVQSDNGITHVRYKICI